jgi:hypothetical protein
VLELYSFVFGLLFASLVTKTRENSILLNAILGGLISMGAVLPFCITEDLRRDRFEKG